MHDQVVEPVRRPARAAQRAQRVIRSVPGGGVGEREGVGEHDGTAVLPLGRPGDAALRVVSQGAEIDGREADAVAGRGPEHDRGARVTKCQACQPLVQQTLDLELRGARQVRDVLTAHHEAALEHALVNQRIDDVDPGEHPRAGAPHVEDHRPVEPEMPLQPE